MSPRDDRRRIMAGVSFGGVILALLVVVSCATQDEANRPTNAPGGTSEHEVRAALSDLGEAVHRQDLDDIVAFFSPDYSSAEATGKSAVREWWTRVINIGLAADLELDLTTAELDVHHDIVEVTYYDERGELACSNVTEACSTPQPYLNFRLERGDQGAWLITGIPSESR